MKNVIIVGGGASGLMAAIFALKNGNKVTIIEKNDILGKKLLITGKGRCNITNACEDTEELIRNVTKNSSFLYSSFYNFTNLQTIDFFNDIGVETKVERGKRVFPKTDKSKTVVDALVKNVKTLGATIINDKVIDILSKDNKVYGVLCKNSGKILCDCVVITTGGVSYPRTGSTGDGLIWAKKLGHKINKPIPSLVPLDSQDKWVHTLAGLSLKNVRIEVLNGKKKKVYTDFGEMMFTHTGITGPVVLSASAHMRPMEKNNYTFKIDLKPALSDKQLDERIIRDFSNNLNKNLDNVLENLLPKRLIEPILLISEVDIKKKVNSVTKEERKKIGSTIKNLSISILDFAPIEQAIITSGGVDISEINPGTMESKIVKNLFFAGEIIDVDAYTGGFNLQIAFSTGYVAGTSI